MNGRRALAFALAVTAAVATACSGSDDDGAAAPAVPPSETAPADCTPARPAEGLSITPTPRELVIDGAVHAQFGDYGVQPGDGSPTITDGRAREQIDAASLRFLKRIDDSEERER